MSSVKSFEELEIWKLARELCLQVRLLTRKEQFSRDFRFCGQFNSAAGSIMDNIAEGFERDGNKEFINFLYIAKGSNGEVRLTDILKFKIQALIQVLKNSGGKGYK